MEIPCVVADITRSGPGIGNISIEQSDYFQIVKGGGHGGYRCPVLAPASAQEMCDFAFKAFDLAEKYRTPVYILADGMIGQMVESVTFPSALEKAKPADYSLTPGNARTNHFTSIYLDTDVLEAKNEALLAKYREMEEHDEEAECFKTEGAEIILVAYGIMSRLAKNAVSELRRIGVPAGLVRPKTLFPFPKKTLKNFVSQAKKFVSIELSGGQMIEDIKLSIECVRPVELIHRVGGKLISVEELVSKVKALA